MTRTHLIAAAFGLTLLAGGAAAQETERDDRRIDRMERTVRQLEGIVRQGAAVGRPVVVAPETLPGEVAVLRERLDALIARLDDMDATRQSLNSTIEGLTNELNQARRTGGEAQAQVRDLQTRIAALEARPVYTPPPPEPVAEPPVAAAGGPPTGDLPVARASGGAAPADAAAAFQRARQRLLEGDYAGASAGFEDFATRFPNDARVQEAQYFLGETLYIRQDYSAAAQAYIAALKGWPKSSWAPDALVKLSGSLVELKQGERACQTLGEFDRRYGASSAAVKARAAGMRTRAKCA
jgi:tol-pal system protein YbgF